MAGKFIAVANMKGGVGKTTTVVTLAESLLAEDPARRVLVVDLDPQASASVTIAGDDALANIIEDGLTLQDHLESHLLEADRTARLMRNIHATLNNTYHQGKRLDLHLLPCGPRLRIIEKRIVYELAAKHGGFTAYEGRLRQLFERDFLPLKARYDYVVFDCPPGISSMAEIAIRHSDMVITPTIPDRISVYGLAAFLQSIWEGQPASAKQPVKPHVLVARNQNTKKHREMVTAMEEKASHPDCTFRMLRTRIPQLQSVATTTDVDHSMPATFRSRYPEDMLAPMRALTREVTEACHGV